MTRSSDVEVAYDAWVAARDSVAIEHLAYAEVAKSKKTYIESSISSGATSEARALTDYQALLQAHSERYLAALERLGDAFDQLHEAQTSEAK